LEKSGSPNAKVEAKLLPVGPGWADLQIHIDRGPSTKVKEVTLSGELGVKSSDAFSALQAMKAKTIVPGIPGIWKGWRMAADYSQDAVRADIANLRSFYYNRGYFDASINLNSTDIRADGARVDFNVRSGPRYAIRQLNLSDAGQVRQISSLPDAAFPARNLCAALFAERRKAERAGILDFAPRIEVRDATLTPLTGGAEVRRWADLTATVQRGPAYRIGRIEIRGNHAFSDLDHPAYVANQRGRASGFDAGEKVSGPH
jgi:outer membrane protein insertion porin family